MEIIFDHNTTLIQFTKSELGDFLMSNGYNISHNKYRRGILCLDKNGYYYEFTELKYISEDMLNLLNLKREYLSLHESRFLDNQSDLKILLETWFRKEKIKKLLM